VVCDPILEIDYTADGAWEMDEKGVIKTVGGMYRSINFGQHGLVHGHKLNFLFKNHDD